MKSMFAVFGLSEAVTGLGSSGLIDDEYAFVLNKYNDIPIANNPDILRTKIREVYADYKKRKVNAKDTRYVILEVFVSDEDEMF